MLFGMSTATRPRPASIQDLLSVTPEARVELIRGTLVDKPEASIGPDLCGYRRERMPERPSANTPIAQLAPDWICEVLSPSHEARDRVGKLHAYFGADVPHYRLMNAEERILEVFRRTDIWYALVLTAGRGERVRPEPFEAAEVAVDELFGDDPEESA